VRQASRVGAARLARQRTSSDRATAPAWLSRLLAMHRSLPFDRASSPARMHPPCAAPQFQRLKGC